ALKFDFTSPTSENGYCGYSEITVFGSASASLTVPPTLVTNTQPATATTVVGDQITFTAAFNSAQAINYQWQVISGGATNNIVGATTRTLTLTNLQLTNTASYQLVASNALGVAMSAPASLTVSNVPAAVNNIITTIATQTGLGSGTFMPGWTVVTNNSLIAGQAPSSSSGNFSMEITGRNVKALTAGAGALLIYSLAGSATGYNLSNIVVYGGWADNGRDQQAYTVSYSTMLAPTNFIALTSVNLNPSDPANAQSATRVTLSSATGALATNVAAVKFDFGSPSSENGYCG